MRTAEELTAFTFRYTHAINVAVAQAYLRESQAVASEAERRRRDLLDHPLAGHAPGAEQERRAETLGLRPTADHVVVVAAAEQQAEHLLVRALVSQDPQRRPHGRAARRACQHRTTGCGACASSPAATRGASRTSSS